MIRRKLFAYTCMFTAGISAGFFIFEKTRLFTGALLMAVTAAAICAAAEMEARAQAGGRGGGREERKKALKTAGLERRRLIICLMAGFLIFTCRYIYYGTALTGNALNGTAADSYASHESETAVTENSSNDNSESSERGGTTNEDSSAAAKTPASEIESIETVTGFADSVTVTDGNMKIVIKDTNAARRGVGVMVNMYDFDPETYDPADIIGRRISAYGRLKEAPGADNPGCFDYRIYLRSRGIGFLFTAKSLELCSEPGACETQEPRQQTVMSLYGSYRRSMYLARENFLDLFEDPDTRSFVKGTVFGDKSDIDEDVREDFNNNGTGHILAVSGLHTGFLYALLRLLAGKRRTAGAAALTIVVLIVYGDMTMWSPSAMRAVTVLSISMLAVFVKRPFDLLSSVSAAAVLILVREPYQLFSTGFQMSFLALLGIAFLAGPLRHFIGEWLAVPVAVQAAMLPVTAFIFHRINLLSVFINIPVIFLASIMVPLSMASLMLSMTAGTVPHLLVMIIEGLSEIIIRLNSFVSADGWFTGLVTSAGPGLLMLFYLTAFLVSSEWCRIRLLRHEPGMIGAAMACILAVSLCFDAASYNGFADDEIVFVSVGQGDCTHVRAGGKDVLIDGGGDTERNIGKEVLMPYLLANGAERVELALVTHLHTDHYLGVVQLAEIYPVGAVGIPADYRKSVEKMYTHDTGSTDTENEPKIVLPENENIEYIEQGTSIYITEDVRIDPVWPLRGSKGDIEIDDANENNTVYIIDYRGIRIMVTGDLLEADELDMIDYYRGAGRLDLLDCDVLKVGHHGSKTSSSEAFLDAVSPELAVIQVGKNNFYGHPHQQTLDRLEERGIPVYRTDLNGAVGIDIRGRGPYRPGTLKVDCMAGGP